MSIRKRGGFYSFEFMERGERFRGTFNGQDGLACARTKQDARESEFEIRIQVRNGTYGKGKEDGLEVFAKFFDSVYLPYAKENTADWKHAEFRGKVLEEFFAGKTFRQITVMVMVGLINARLKSKTKRGTVRDPTTVYKEVALASAVFRMAISEGIAESNPCEHLPAATRKKIWARNKRDRFLTDDEEPKLFAQLVGRRAHLFSIVRFDLETGLRKSELCRLETGHVNLSDEARVFKINNKAVTVEPGELLVTKSKNGKPRTRSICLRVAGAAE
jgi:integrase